MNLHALPRRIGASAAVIGVAALVAGTGADAGQVQPQPAIGPKAAGGVKIGASYTSLRRKGLIGKIGPGCELAGPNARSARLKSPLKGSVDFTFKSPRRVTTITITGGSATARGVGIGDTLEDIQAAYPKAKVDHSSDETFEFTLVTIPKSGGGKLQFAVSTKTGKITLIGVPNIAFCE
jgi:hypothetical protein